MADGTPVKIHEVFRAPEAPEDTSRKRKRKEGGRNEEDMKRRNTSTEPNAGPSGTKSTPRLSSLPVSRAKIAHTAQEAAPLEMSAVPNP